MASITDSPSIPVENPATGEVIREVPVTDPDAVAGLVATAREAQKTWEELGFDGRAKVLKRMQRWLLDHGDEVVDTIVSETGKTHEDARLVELAYGANALGFWAKKAPKWLADEKVHTTNPFVLLRRLVV